MITMKDVAVRAGICWRYIDADAPDHDPTYNNGKGEGDPTPPKWTTWEVETLDEPSNYTKVNGHRRVELLEHFSTHPTPTLLKNQTFDVKYITVRTCQVRADQWYLGIWSRSGEATNVCRGLNNGAVQTSNYRNDRGPIQDSGFAIVLVDTVGKAPSPPSLPAEVIRSCVDPIDKLLKQRVSGMPGAICFTNYEGAQRTESLVRTNHGFVSTNAEFPLNEGQCALAQEIWPFALRLRFARAADKERHRVVCDDVDEMPNMADG
jgi:hypothetical protein